MACTRLAPSLGSSVIDLNLWKRFLMDKDISADIPLTGESVAMSSSKAASLEGTVLTADEQEQAIAYLLDQSIESVLHDILLEIHQSEKVARMQTAVVEVEQRAEKLGKKSSTDGPTADDVTGDDAVETSAAVYKSGSIQLKGNPMKTLKHQRCPNCRLPRLLYPRVGFNSRPVPDASTQYCKSEPMIILDKHDVHGQRKKGVKVKGAQAKGKNKKSKATDATSPAPSENSDPLTPSSSMPANDSIFEFKEIDYPAAKCPNRDSHLGDHWKSVNIFATHLNGSCYLKKDRAAGREANAKIGGTPRDSRANSPKPTPVANGTKRKAEDAAEGPAPKKKTKVGKDKKEKAPPAPSKLKEVNNAESEKGDSPAPNGTIEVTPTKANKEGSEGPKIKLKFGSTGGGDGVARKKPSKPSKKA